MSDPESHEFNAVIKHIIQKSLFTERQVQIILRQQRRAGVGFGISRGAYYRQASQSRDKMGRLYYTISLLWGLGVLEPRDIDVMSHLAEQIKGLKDSDILGGREEDITQVLDKIVSQACNV